MPFETSARVRVNRIFIAVAVLSSTFGNYFLAAGMERMPDFGAVSFAAYTLKFFTDWQIFLGVALLAIWMTSQLTMFSWADLSYVLPVTATGYVLTALLGEFLLHEHISTARWAGVVLIAIGSMLASFTPIQTVPHGHPDELAE